MRAEPPVKQAIAFFDGQNLFHAVKEAFGYKYPNFDPAKLAAQLCMQKGWQLKETRFYTGIPNALDKPAWHQFWTAKLSDAFRGTTGSPDADADASCFPS